MLRHELGGVGYVMWKFLNPKTGGNMQERDFSVQGVMNFVETDPSEMLRLASLGGIQWVVFWERKEGHTNEQRI